MRLRRSLGILVAAATALSTAGTLGSPALAAPAATHVSARAHHAPARWAAQGRTGSVRLAGQVPLAVHDLRAGRSAPVSRVGAHAATTPMSLNFSLPLHDTAGLDRLIATEARTHHYLSRAEIYRRFAPPAAQVQALSGWLRAHGYTITHVSPNRTSVAASASTATVERTLSTPVSDYVRAASSFEGVAVPAYTFFANTLAPKVPARLGVSAISGLSDVDRFFTDTQLAAAAQPQATASGPQGILTRAGGGYYPQDVRSLYDVAGHNVDATGQTIGFTLWGAGETQAAMTSFANTTGDPLITVDAACTASNNAPTTPSSCTTQQVAPNHLVSILENGNTNGSAGTYEYAGNAETALDIEQAHGMASGAAMKYYLADCSNTVPVGSGLSNATCNGSDVGLEEAVEDAASDPTLHTVSNSWGYGGDTEWGNADPFKLAVESSFALGAAAGTTFWFSTGDSGTYESGFPADSPYVVGVGGTSDYSSNVLAAGDKTTTAQRSTSTTWAAGGSWCSSLSPRPAWQTGAAVAAKTSCPGRSVPDISGIADTNTSVYEAYTSTNTGTVRTGGVGGTSVAAPEYNGMEAVTEAYLAQQTYAGGSTPAIGFEGPMIYQLGNSSHSAGYFNDIVCGNTASPAGGPDGDAAGAGWDPATGWGEIDWYDFSTGYAIALGATGLTQPASLNPGYAYGCAQTPTNASERAVSLPTANVGYSVGAPSGTTPWPAKFLAAGSWGASSTILKTTDGGATWTSTNADQLSVACPTTSTCITVGDGGRIRRTTDSGATWTYVASTFTKALTSISCPSASTCFAAGDRGTVLKSTDAGATWSFTATADGNPIYGLSCPTASVCYAADVYAHVEKTTDGGTSWTLMSTPITTPGINVPGSGGPNPFAGLFGITCSDASTCVAVGGYPATGTDPPIVRTTDGGTTWTLETSNAGNGHYLNGVTCVGATCYAVGRAGTIVTSADGGVTWTAMTSNTTVQLTGLTCTSATTCTATGQGGTIDELAGGTWTATTGAGAANFLAAVACTSPTSCVVTGKQGVTLLLDPTNPAAATQVAGGGTIQSLAGLSCVDPADCVAVGGAGVILATANAGQLWTPEASTTTAGLTGVSCVAQHCEAVGGVVSGAAVILGSTDGGVTWTAQTSGSTVALSGVSCSSATFCVAVGAGGKILTTADGGTTWTTQTSGTTAGLTSVSCPTGTACYAVGAILAPATTATILTSVDHGVTWTTRSSHAPQGLTSVACVNDVACFAGGAIGTVVTTVDGGVTWTQQGDPISGPPTALNVGPTGITAINAVACSAVTCVLGTASAGDLMSTPVLTVTVAVGGSYGSAPAITGLAPSTSGLTYSPAGQAGNVTGTLTCSTTATATSDPGSYPVSGCSGLVDPGYSVVYDLDDSTYTTGKAAQSITFPSIADHTYGDAPFTPNAAASSGLPVSFTAAGTCDVTPAGQVEITGAGSCTVTASQPGNVDYAAAAPVQETFTIAKAAQTITFGSLDPKTFGDASFEIDPTASSGLTVSVSASGPCTLDSATSPANVTITGAGTCSITATQAGGANYLPAVPVTMSFDVAKANQTISFAPIPDATYGDGPITLGATASSGLAVSYTAAGACTVAGDQLTITGAGSCTVTAAQGGDADYNPAAQVGQTFAIAAAAQTITFPQPGDVRFDQTTTLTATASSGLAVIYTASGPCTVTGATITPTGVGQCMVVAYQTGDSDHLAADPVTRTFAITPGQQTISFTAPGDRSLGSRSFTVAATATSGLPVAFTAGPADVCTVDGSTVSLTGTGTCTVTASQAGDADWAAAAPVERSFTVSKADTTVTVTDRSSPVTGTQVLTVHVGTSASVPVTGSVAVTAGGRTCTVSSLSAGGSGACSVVLPAGPVTLGASYSGNGDLSPSTGSSSVTIARSTTTISLSTAVKELANGTHKLTVTTTILDPHQVKPGGTVLVKAGRDLRCTAPVKAGAAHCSVVLRGHGTIPVVVTYSGDANHTAASSSVNLKVS